MKKMDMKVVEDFVCVTGTTMQITDHLNKINKLYDASVEAMVVGDKITMVIRRTRNPHKENRFSTTPTGAPA